MSKWAYQKDEIPPDDWEAPKGIDPAIELAAILVSIIIVLAVALVLK